VRLGFSAVDSTVDVVTVRAVLHRADGQALPEIEVNPGPGWASGDRRSTRSRSGWAEIELPTAALPGWLYSHFDGRFARREWRPEPDRPWSIRMWLIDREGLESEPVEVVVREPEPVDAGAVCDTRVIFDRCPEGHRCESRAVFEDEIALCRAPDDRCPADWELVDVALEADGGEVPLPPGIAQESGFGPVSGCRYLDGATQDESLIMLHARHFCGFESSAIECLFSDNGPVELRARVAAGESVLIVLEGDDPEASEVSAWFEPEP
jgi:hypothetical protein